MTDTPLTVQNLNPVIVDCITWIKKTPPFVLDEAVIHDLLEFSANETRRALEAWQQDEHELSENEKDTLEACEVLLSTSETGDSVPGVGAEVAERHY